MQKQNSACCFSTAQGPVTPDVATTLLFRLFCLHSQDILGYPMPARLSTIMPVDALQWFVAGVSKGFPFYIVSRSILMKPASLKDRVIVSMS